MLSLSVVAALLTAILARANSQGEQNLGPLLECAHSLKGTVTVVNDKKVVITGFQYDGKGPAAWFHGQLRPAVEISNDPDKGKGFVTLPFPDASCDQLSSTSYKDENVTLILPRSITEFHTIGILCYKFCHNFGHVIIPENLQVPPAPADQLVTNDCPIPAFDKCAKVNQGTLQNCENPP